MTPTMPTFKVINGDVGDHLSQLQRGWDLCFADPPWQYDQHFGQPATGDDGKYEGLPYDQILSHLQSALDLSNRLVLWMTWVHVGPFLAYSGLKPVTGGAWHKHTEENGGHYGQGYHWSGCTEPVLIFNGRGHGWCDRAAPLRNGWVENPTAHSRKPVVWQAAMIRRWVPLGGTVLDLYAGLGSVGEATILAGGGRSYLGFEVNEARADRARQNIEHRLERVRAGRTS